MATALAGCSLAAQDGYEPPPVLTATALLGAAGVKGPHYQVGDAVRTDEYFHEFTIASDYGAFEAIGRSELAVRIHEIGALASLDDVSKTQVFLSAAGQSVVNVGKGAAAVVTNPEGTVKGLGAGIKRFGVNLGRRTERAAASTTDEKAGDEESAAGSAAGSLLGVNAAFRRWAQKVGVDPYTTNVVLRKALGDIANVDAAGSIATKVAVPIPGVVGLTSTVGAIVWGKDPEEVRKINEAGLRALRVTDAVAKKLFGNKWVTLTYQTRLVAALGFCRCPRRRGLRRDCCRRHERARGAVLRRERRNAPAVARARTRLGNSHRLSCNCGGGRRWSDAGAGSGRLDSLERRHAQGTDGDRLARSSGASRDATGARADRPRFRTRGA